MKTKTEAAIALLAAGWTPVEIRAILGNLPEAALSSDHPSDPSPWWSWVDEDWYTGGTLLVKEWEAWVNQGDH